MAKSARIILLFTLMTLLAISPVWAKKKKFCPVPEGVSVQWVPVPQVGGVSYAPNISADLFSYGGQFYCYSNNLWYAGSALAGPWQTIQAPPQVFYQIAPTYFKTPPGWAKGKKTGWGGAPMPPGQMKKYSK